MYSSLKELFFIKSKSEFIDYYNRCLVFNVPVCENVRFSVGKFNNIGIDISGVREEEVVIPPFVNYIYRDLAHPGVNYNIKKLDLCNVNTISDYGLSDFRQLEEVKGDKLEGISDNAFYGCNRLRVLDCKNVKAIGACGLSCCSGLEVLELPELMYTKQNWCFYTSLNKLYAPKLIKLEPLSFSSRKAIQVSLGKDTIIQQQDFTIRFVLNNMYVHWYGLSKTIYFLEYQNYVDKGILMKNDKYGYYTTWGNVLKVNNLYEVRDN